MEQIRVLHERAEQSHGRDHRGRDCKSLRQRLGRVADRVEPVDYLACAFIAALLFLLQRSRHLENPVGVVRDRPEGVHRQDEPGRRQQAEPGERDSVRRERRVAVEYRH